MPKRLYVGFELPDEVAAQLHEAEMAVKAKEALVIVTLQIKPHRFLHLISHTNSLCHAPHTIPT